MHFRKKNIEYSPIKRVYIFHKIAHNKCSRALDEEIKTTREQKLKRGKSFSTIANAIKIQLHTVFYSS